VLSAGGSETADDTGSAELISELVLSAAEGATGCDETVLLFAKVLFGVFCSLIQALPRKEPKPPL